MADLLECVLQIKGLRETANRLAELVDSIDANCWNTTPAPGSPSSADLVAQLAEIEKLHGTWLRLMLASNRPALPPPAGQSAGAPGRFRPGDVRAALQRFLALRRDNLERLDRCSADDLSRVGVHPIRRETTIADLVALMLASDVEHLGEIRRMLGGRQG